MDAKICDRCGKVCTTEYKDYFKEIESLGNKTIRVEIEYANAYQTIRKVDLCTDCKKSLLNWLEGISEWQNL